MSDYQNRIAQLRTLELELLSEVEDSGSQIKRALEELHRKISVGRGPVEAQVLSNIPAALAVLDNSMDRANNHPLFCWGYLIVHLEQGTALVDAPLEQYAVTINVPKDLEQFVQHSAGVNRWNVARPVREQGVDAVKVHVKGKIRRVRAFLADGGTTQVAFSGEEMTWPGDAIMLQVIIGEELDESVKKVIDTNTPDPSAVTWLLKNPDGDELAKAIRTIAPRLADGALSAEDSRRFATVPGFVDARKSLLLALDFITGSKLQTAEELSKISVQKFQEQLKLVVMVVIEGKKPDGTNI